MLGYPTVRLNVEADKPDHRPGGAARRDQPDHRASHLVSYTFFNLVYRDGDQADPKPVPPGVFGVEIPLNIIGHVFKRGWKLRVAISPFSFPGMWRVRIPTVKIHTGRWTAARPAPDPAAP